MQKIQLDSKKNTYLLILISIGFFGIFLLYKLNFSNNQYSEKTRKFGQYSGLYKYFVKGRPIKNSASTIKEDTNLPPVKGAFVVVTRNEELQALITSIRSLEDHFNHEYSYPWIFLNEDPFTKEFKRLTRMVTRSKVQYGLIQKWKENTTNDANKHPSGSIVLHPLFDDLDYYWRVEPGVKFSANIDHDPFRLMQKRDFKYGFMVALREYLKPTVWEATQKYVQSYPQYIYPRTRKDSLLGLVSDDNGWSYNLCRFKGNFEIASTKFMRSDGYQSYFRYFNHESTGEHEAVQSIGVAIMLKKSDIHWFYDAGGQDITFDIGSCTLRFLEAMNKANPDLIY
ncbi:unnamed protein product [Rhizopus stolonifer]